MTIIINQESTNKGTVTLSTIPGEMFYTVSLYETTGGMDYRTKELSYQDRKKAQATYARLKREVKTQ